MNRTIITTAILAALALPLTAADDHAGHDHSKEGAHEAKVTDLGRVVVGGVTVAVSRHGEITAGKTIQLDLSITPAKPAPKAIRLWIGNEAGKASTKAKADMHGDHGHVDVEVPAPLPEGSAVWIQVDPAEGAATKASLPLVTVKKAEK